MPSSLGETSSQPASQPPAPLAPGEVIDTPSLPPVADDLGMPDLSKPLEIEPYAPPLASLEEAPAAAAPETAPAPQGSPTVPVAPPSASGDPLLGPNPELMPSSLGETSSPEAPVAAPNDSAAAAPSPAPVPVPAPTPTPTAEPSAPVESVETSSLPELSPSPATGGGVAPEPAPALEPPAAPIDPTTSSASPTASDSETLAARRPAPRVDPEVRKTSAAEAVAEQVDSEIDPNWRRAGETAARVGDEVITMRELTIGVKDQLKRHGVKASQLPREEINLLAQNVLANLIDRSLMYQEAQHQLKDKQMSKLLDIADKVWLETELPSLIRQNFVTSEHQLRTKMEESGRSLAALKLSHRQDFVAMLYVQEKLKDKMRVELPEMLRYYNTHINDKANFRAARITWREVLVERSKHPSPAEARRKAEELLARLQGGEDFAKLAKAESEGPSAVKAQGGLMETSPNGYAVAAVNQAIETLPLGEVSSVIAGPSSFHIVRVEQRRPAGPASFAELQDQIRREIFNEKSTRERRQLLERLRANNVVATIFDGTESDPNTVRR